MSNNKQNNKRLKSAIAYTDALIADNSKLNIIRVDLSYDKPYSENITLNDANNDFNRMMNNRRSKPSVFKDQEGYICKQEYTESKGIHFHTLFMYDGQKVQNSSYKADQIGKYWEEITGGKGSYHNCHRNEYDSDSNGIGLLDRKDKKKRTILVVNVLSYFCKEEQTIEPVKNSSKDRAFKRGTIKKDQKKEGRSRS